MKIEITIDAIVAMTESQIANEVYELLKKRCNIDGKKIQIETIPRESDWLKDIHFDPPGPLYKTNDEGGLDRIEDPA